MLFRSCFIIPRRSMTLMEENSSYNNLPCFVFYLEWELKVNYHIFGFLHSVMFALNQRALSNDELKFATVAA